MIFSYVYNNLNESELLRKELRNYIRNINDKDVYLSIFENNTIFRSAKKGIKNYPDDKEFIEQFILKYKIYKKLYNYVEKEDSKLRGELISIDEFALAVTKGIIEKDEFYIEILNRENTKSKVKALCDIIYGNKTSDKKENNRKKKGKR